jgi:hypothetical protein
MLVSRFWKRVRKPVVRNPRARPTAQHLCAHRDDLFTFLRQPGLDATN